MTLIKMLVVILWVIMFCAGMGSAEDKPSINYCDDKAAWEEWDKLVEKYPHDMEVQMLHAVRIGFCKKIKDGTIAFESARDIFNQLQDSVYQKSKNLQELRMERLEL